MACRSWRRRSRLPRAESGDAPVDALGRRSAQLLSVVGGCEAGIVAAMLTSGAATE